MKRKIMILLAKMLRRMTGIGSPWHYDTVLYVKLGYWLKVQEEVTARNKVASKMKVTENMK